jgi:hypothetical protein
MKCGSTHSSLQTFEVLGLKKTVGDNPSCVRYVRLAKGLYISDLKYYDYRFTAVIQLLLSFMFLFLSVHS